MDLATVLISGAVGAVTSAITAYFTSKMKVSEEREKWSRELSQKYAEASATNPEIAAKIARQFGIALIVVRRLDDSALKAQGEFCMLPNSRQVLGREADCDILLDDRASSVHHAAFWADSENVYIENLKAPNPTLVNGEILEGRARLRNGDQVTIGKTRLELVMLAA